eukprot:Skav214133  [mRNA]  locus=scaffold1185:673759:674152:- [translate_table: standard]
MPQSPQLARVATVSAALLALQLSFKWRQLLKRLQARDWIPAVPTRINGVRWQPPVMLWEHRTAGAVNALGMTTRAGLPSQSFRLKLRT